MLLDAPPLSPNGKLDRRALPAPLPPAPELEGDGATIADAYPLAPFQDHVLAPSRPYREHIAWLQRQDMAPVEAFWRATLRGFAQPTPLVRRAPGNAPPDVDDYVMQQGAPPTTQPG